jgi:hypothetical protein
VNDASEKEILKQDSIPGNTQERKTQKNENAQKNEKRNYGIRGKREKTKGHERRRKKQKT